MKGRILITLGPALSIRGVLSDVVFGTAANFLFRAVGAVGQVRMNLRNSQLPLEWSFTDNEDGTANLTTSLANTEGKFYFQVEAEDYYRQPVIVRFSIEVTKNQIFDPCASYAPPDSPIGLVLEIGESDENDALENVTEPTGGLFEVCEEII